VSTFEVRFQMDGASPSVKTRISRPVTDAKLERAVRRRWPSLAIDSESSDYGGVIVTRRGGRRVGSFLIVPGSERNEGEP
jgi:hypothetical protein